MAAGDLLGLLDHPMLTTEELTACLVGRASRGAGSRGASPALVATAGGSRAPGRRAWALLLQGLARHAGVLVLDCGPGLGGPGATPPSPPPTSSCW